MLDEIESVCRSFLWFGCAMNSERALVSLTEEWLIILRYILVGFLLSVQIFDRVGFSSWYQSKVIT